MRFAFFFLIKNIYTFNFYYYYYFHFNFNFVQYDELLELEWLSNFVEECEYIQNLELITGVKVKPHEPTAVSTRNAAAIFNPDVVSVPAKARSKRSRAVVSNWNNSLLLPLSPTTSSSESEINADPPQLVKKAPPKAVVTAKKKDSSEGGVSPAGEERRCMHCATDKTPQWRTGPMGPKTLCNACGVRYKSGRLVPEYRPAASPTFVLTKHSNSHRKVMELRRQKEIIRGQQPQPLVLDHHRDLIFDASSCDNYLIYQHVGPIYVSYAAAVFRRAQPISSIWVFYPPNSLIFFFFFHKQICCRITRSNY